MHPNPLKIKAMKLFLFILLTPMTIFALDQHEKKLLSDIVALSKKSNVVYAVINGNVDVLKSTPGAGEVLNKKMKGNDRLCFVILSNKIIDIGTNYQIKNNQVITYDPKSKSIISIPIVEIKNSLDNDAK